MKSSENYRRFKKNDHNYSDVWCQYNIIIITLKNQENTNGFLITLSHKYIKTTFSIITLCKKKIYFNLLNQLRFYTMTPYTKEGIVLPFFVG